MVMRTNFILLNTEEKLNDITVKSGSYSSTFNYPYTNATGTIPAAQCGSDMDMEYTITFEENDVYEDESEINYQYEFQFIGLGSGTWTVEGIQLLSTGYVTLTLTDDNINDLMFVHPTIQIPNITINGNDYWDSHKTQYNNLIGTTAGPITLNLQGYPTSNTVTIEDPTNGYYFLNNEYEMYDNKTISKGSNITVKAGKTPEFLEIPREIDSNGVLNFPSSLFTFSVPSNVTKIEELRYCFSNCPSLASVNMNSVEEVGNMSYCFSNCTSLASVDMNNVNKIGNNGLSQCFQNCTSLTTAPTFANLTKLEHNYDMSGCFSGCTSLTTAPTFANLEYICRYSLQNCFYGCTSLTTAPTFANLKNMEDYGNFNSCFYGCTSLTTAPTFNNLISIGDSSTFYMCFRNTKITSLSFPKLNQISFGNYTYTTHFDYMLQGVTGCTVHFPSSLQSVIGDWSSVTSGFSGTNTTVLFDLPATIGYKAFGNTNNNPSPKDYKVFLQSKKPQVGDNAWVFPENNNRTSYDINAEDVIQTTILNSASTNENSVWLSGNYLYVRLNGSNIYITPTNQNRWDLCYLV